MPSSGLRARTIGSWAGLRAVPQPSHRKPLAGTVAHNVLTYGTGALNIDGTRIVRAEGDTSHAGNRTATFGTQLTVSGGDGSGGWEQSDAGRWPANVILDDTINDDWARYFYCAKPSKAERNAGLDYLPTKQTVGGGGLTEAGGAYGSIKAPGKNFHPTVKPLTLMRYLIRLVTPPGGIVLDPFTGSGTTLVAAQLEGFNSTGIEMTDEYLPIITGRLRWATEQNPPQLNPSEAHGVTEPT